MTSVYFDFMDRHPTASFLANFTAAVVSILTVCVAAENLL